MILENRLKEYRTKLHMNQSQLGELTGISRQTVSLIERGNYAPSVAVALRLAKVCKVNVEDIFFYSESEQ